MMNVGLIARLGAGLRRRRLAALLGAGLLTTSAAACSPAAVPA
ncbi:MAG TPA: hypothetical protein PLP95_09670 [Microthrixaceae bacterium]|nr:hypothetical protein [Microthrixaceae bacterium]